MVGGHNQISEPAQFANATCHEESHVAILMAVFNGAAWLPDQLYSFKRQTHSNWSLLVSDDGSTDDSKDLIACFARANRDTSVQLIDGPGQGFAANFLKMLCQVDDASEYIAFADQDDSWLPGKLERGIAAIAEVPAGTPALYCGRTWVCSRRLRPKHPSQEFKHKPSFENAIVQNIGGGNTMVFNNAALKLLKLSLGGSLAVASHDWWVYQIVSGAGGKIIYDTEPMVLYRQHESNVIGAGNGLRATFARLAMVLTGKYKGWNEMNIQALYRAVSVMTPNNASLLRSFKTARGTNFRTRIRMLFQSGIHHQTRLGNAGFWLAAVLNRV